MSSVIAKNTRGESITLTIGSVDLDGVISEADFLKSAAIDLAKNLDHLDDGDIATVDDILSERDADEKADSGSQTIKRWSIGGVEIMHESDNYQYVAYTSGATLTDYLKDWDGGLEEWANFFNYDYPCGNEAAPDYAGKVILTKEVSNWHSTQVTTPVRDDDGVVVFDGYNDAIEYDGYDADKHTIRAY
jgi:hypothetical protein